MAKSPAELENQRLKSEIKHLAEENQRLREKIVPASATKNSHFGRKVFATLFVIIAVTLLVVGNILFWAGNTVVKTDRYTDSVEPLIRQPAIQSAISSYATQQIFMSVDAEALTQEVLPPRAAFLAPTLADKLQENTQGTINKIVASQKFQNKWNDTQLNAHAKLITSIEQNGADGVLDMNEFYAQINDDLKNTRLAFLADKPLPPKVGSIKIVEGKSISTLHKFITNIDTWRTIAILMLIASSALAVWLSRMRRKTIIKIGLLSAVAMFITMLAVRIGRELIAGRVDQQYAAAASEAARTILYPLQVQSATLLAFGLLVAFIAWVSGPSKSAAKLTSKVQLLFGGKLHYALFSTENSLTFWFGRHKRIMQWSIIVVLLTLLLIVRLTPEVLVIFSTIAIIWTLFIEVLSAPKLEEGYSPS